MGWNQIEHEIEYLDAEVVKPPPVKKKVWDGEKFVTVMWYKIRGTLNDEQKLWLVETFGFRGERWDYSNAGNFWIMDEKAYMWFQMKWGNK